MGTDRIARALAGSGFQISNTMQDIFDKTFEPTGFSFPQDLTVNYDEFINVDFDKSNRTFSISPKNTSYEVYSKGKLYLKTATESIQIANTSGLHFFYFDSDGVLKTSMAIPFFTDGHAGISYVYWNAVEQKEIIFGLETHGSVMDWATHLYEHEANGTKYINGLLAGNYSLIGDGSQNSHAQLSISNGQIDDEDIRFFIKHASTPTKWGEQVLSSIAEIPVMYKSGTLWNIDIANQYPVKQGTARIKYNLNTAGNWTTPDSSGDDKFVAMWLFASNTKSPIYAILGQREDSSLNDAITNNTFSSLDLTNMPILESKCLWRLIFKTNSTYANTPKCTLADIESQLNIQGLQISAIATADHNTLTNRNAINSHPASAMLYDDTISLLGVDNLQDATGKLAEETLYRTSGVIYQPTITDNLNGTITVGNTVALTYDNINFQGRLLKSTVIGNTFTLTDQNINYLSISHNNGSPIYYVTTNRALLNSSDNLFVNTMYRDGNDLHFLSWDAPAVGLSEKLQERLISTQRFVRESGLLISESPTRIVNISSGVTWNGTSKIFLDAFTSASDPRIYYYHVGGVWTEDIVGTQYKNDVYDNGIDLVTATAGKYLVNWIYRAEESLPHAYLILGTSEYDTIGQASESQPPTNLPPLVARLAILVGQIIVKVGENTASRIDSAFNKEFIPAPVNNHNELSLMQGGTTNEYYHLTQSEVAEITHDNRVNLDNINQNLGTSNSPTFANQKITGYHIDSISSTPVTNGNIDNWVIPNVSILIISSATGNFSIRGISGGVNGRMLTIINNTSNNMTITNLNAGSTAINQIDTLGGNFTTTGKGVVQMVYDGTNWKVISTVS